MLNWNPIIIFWNILYNLLIDYLLESVLEFTGNRSVVFWLFHDFADHSLLAVKIIIVEVLVHILEYLDPLEDVDSFPWGILVGPILML